MQKIKYNSGGFTLVEILLYVTITATIMISISILLQTLLEGRVRNQTAAEVEQQGTQVMQAITQSIRNAQGVNSPSIGTSGESLELDVVIGGDNPTTFDVAGGIFRITEGSPGTAVPLTNNRVSISTTTFENLSRTTTATTVRVQFTLEYLNSSNRSEFEYSKTFYGTASVR